MAGAAVWGTGWYYPPYYWGGGYYPIYYPYGRTYGYGSWYNPYTGVYGTAGRIYGPYGGVGYGARYNATISATPYGKPGSNRLNLLTSGASAPTIVVPATVADRFAGPAAITSGTVIPRNALEGLPLRKVDLRLTKEVKLSGRLKASLIGEIYNVFNRANYTIDTVESSATYLASVAGQGRSAQVGFRLTF